MFGVVEDSLQGVGVVVARVAERRQHSDEAVETARPRGRGRGGPDGRAQVAAHPGESAGLATDHGRDDAHETDDRAGSDGLLGQVARRGAADGVARDRRVVAGSGIGRSRPARRRVVDGRRGVVNGVDRPGPCGVTRGVQ